MTPTSPVLEQAQAFVPAADQRIAELDRIIADAQHERRTLAAFKRALAPPPSKRRSQASKNGETWVMKNLSVNKQLEYAEGILAMGDGRWTAEQYRQQIGKSMALAQRLLQHFRSVQMIALAGTDVVKTGKQNLYTLHDDAQQVVDALAEQVRAAA